MTLQDHLRILREGWLLVALCVALGLVGAVAAFVLRPAQYTATLTLYVSSQGGDTAQQAYQGAQLSQQRVTSYVELVGGRRVAEDVVRRLRLPDDPEDLLERIEATSALDSVLIDVSVEDRSPQRAAELADAVGEVFVDLVDELERPVASAAPQAVAVRVVQPAVAPTTPSSTGLPVLLALGLLAGTALGVGGALLRHALDTSVTTPEQLHRAAGAPTLGTIAHDPDVPRRPPGPNADPQSPRAEAFRQLRTNLQFVDVDNPRKVLLVTSSMPAEGKTTTVVNLALAMSSAGNRVLVVEGDLRRPRVSELLGLERSVGLTSVLSGRVDVEPVVQPWGGGAFDVLSSGPIPPNPSELLASRQMQELLAELRRQYDVVLIDSPPLLPVTDAAAVAPSTDGALLVCRYRRTSRAEVEAARRALDAVSARLLGTVFTMVPASGPHAHARYNSSYRDDGHARAVVPVPGAAAAPTSSGSHRAVRVGPPRSSRSTRG